MKRFEKLVSIIKALRAPDGCPWDKEQTFKTLTPHIIEEAYELVDAIESDDFSHIKEELGDVLLHVVMISNMAEEQSKFDIYDVAETVTNKMITRHPHVFGDTKVDSVDDAWKNWEAIKKTEKETKSIMTSIPNQLPALLQAYKIQKKASRVGFDWPSFKGPIDKIKEEIDELEVEINANNIDKIKNEAGDILFALVNILRKCDINPEEALQRTNKTFKNRFQHMEESAKNSKQTFSDLSLEQQEQLWDQAKKA